MNCETSSRRFAVKQKSHERMKRWKGSTTLMRNLDCCLFFLFLYPPQTANHPALMLPVLRDDTCLSWEPRLAGCQKRRGSFVCASDTSCLKLGNYNLVAISLRSLMQRGGNSFFFFSLSSDLQGLKGSKCSVWLICAFTVACIAARGEELWDHSGAVWAKMEEQPRLFMGWSRLFMGHANGEVSTQNGSFKRISGAIWQGSNINVKVN